MIGNLMRTASRLAVVSATGTMMLGLALAPAKAADLGGDCCADLEERVADLEATTVRKGNKKVSLKISGQVSRVVGYLTDDAGDSELYSAGNGTAYTRMQFDGSAKLTSSWTAGYQLRARVNGNADTSGSLTHAGDANYDNGTSTSAIEVDRNYVYLSNDSIGTFLVGQAGGPTDGVARISLAGNDVVVDARGSKWNNIAKGFTLEHDDRYQAIAYVSPTLAGFTLAAAWADVDGPSLTGDTESDVIDAALRYAGEFGPIRVAAGIGYSMFDDGTDGSAVMGSAALMHTPTGLNVAASAGQNMDGGVAGGSNSKWDKTGAKDAEFWYVQGGINQNFTGMGSTAVYGEYGNYDSDDGSDAMTMWGLGVVQKFDSAATELFLAYRNWQDDDSDCSATGCDTDGDTEVSQVMAGMRIKF